MPANLTHAADLWTVVAWTMVHFLWTGALLWMLAAIVRRLTRRVSPGTRYGIALLTLTSAVFLAAVIAGRVTANGGLLAIQAAPIDIPEVSTEAALQRTASPLPVPVIAQGDAGVSLPETVPSIAGPAWEFVTPILSTGLRFLPWVWLIGSPLVALLFAGGLVRTVQMRSASEPLQAGPAFDALQQLRERLRIRRTVTLAVSSRTVAPIVIGILRPAILVPPSILTGLAPAQIEMILLHELAHVRRWDNLVNLLQRAAESLLFFHPLVWWASRWARLERELCCDNLVLAHHGDRQQYAETLASLALPELAPQYAVAAMANHQLVLRIRRILNAEEATMPFTSRSVGWSVAVLAGVAIACVVGFDVQARTARADGSQSEEQSADANAGVVGPIGTPLELWGHSEDSAATANAIDKALQYLAAQNSTDAELRWSDLGPASLWIDAGKPPGWAAAQATGEPNVPTAGDDQRAWASQSEDGSQEWLLVGFEEPIHAAAILVYEPFNPGALVKIVRIGDDGSETTLWEGTDPVSREQQSGVAAITVAGGEPVQYLKLHFDSPSVPGWNEIDAVCLIDRRTGQAHWAKHAAASSTYARATDVHSGATLQNCGKCHANAHEWQPLRHPPHPISGDKTEQLYSWIHDNRQASDRTARIRQLEAELELLRRLEATESGRELEVEESADDLPTGHPNPSRVASDLWRQAFEQWKLMDGSDDAVDPNNGLNIQWEFRQDEHGAGDADPSADVLDEFRRALQEQQRAIDRLNELLQSIAPAAEGADDKASGTESESDQSAADRRFLEQYYKIEGAGNDAVALRRLFLDLTGLPPSEDDMERLRSGAISLTDITSSVTGNNSASSAQIHFRTPTAMKVTVVDTDEEITVPGRVNLSTGQDYTLQFTKIPSRAGFVVKASAKFFADEPTAKTYLAHNAVPFSITSEDLEQVASNNLVTKVVYLPTDNIPSETGSHVAIARLEQIVSTRLDPGVDPIEAARKRGAIVAVLRLGDRDGSGF